MVPALLSGDGAAARGAAAPSRPLPLALFAIAAGGLWGACFQAHAWPGLASLLAQEGITPSVRIGGQDYIASMEPKIRRIQQMVAAGGHDCDVEVDGGIGPATVQAAAAAGGNVLVAGSAL